MADIKTPMAQEGTWTLTAPDGRTWQAESPLRCCAAESNERIPAEVAMARILQAADESASDEQDAKRYRWLRALSPGKGNRWPHLSIYPWHEGIDGAQPMLPVHDRAGYHPGRLDQWIDAAIAEAGSTT